MLDRAQGATTYDKALLINIDRLAGDDYKGVGEGYMSVVTNTFRLKFGIVGENDDIERYWQKVYDEGLAAFIGSQPMEG